MSRTGGVMVVVLGWMFACAGMTPEERAAWEKKVAAEREAAAVKTAEATERTRAWATSLQTIAQRLDPEGRSPRGPCAPEVFAALPKAGFLRDTIPAIGFESLPGAEPYGDRGDWSWLDDDDLLRLPKVLTGAETNEVFVAHWGEVVHNRFVLVYLAEERALPSAVTGRTAFSEGSYDSGWWTGDVRLVDLESRTVVCSAPVTASNSAEVDFDDEGVLKDDPSKVTLVDFQQNLEDATNTALESIAPRFQVNIVGLL